MVGSNPDNCFSLEGKTAIITGGAGLLGRQHGAALAAIGARVVISDLDGALVEEVAAEISRETGGHAVGLVLDVTDPEQVAAVQRELAEEFGGIHVLVNNAAIDPKVREGAMVETSRLENFPLEQWNHQIDVGLTGAFLCSRVFGLWMAENGGGVILNIASDLSVIAPDQRLYRSPSLPPDKQPVKPVTYSVIKTALVGLTRYLATYWAEQNVRVNALSPGGVFDGQDGEFVNRLTQLIPMGRMANKDEYRGAVQFLCSDASRYMTGQNIVIDGGRSVL